MRDPRSDDSIPWPTAALDSVADVVDPHPSHRAPNAVAGGIPFPGIGDFDTNGDVSVDNCRLVPEGVATEHATRYEVEEGDIGFGRVATIGKIIRLKPLPFKFAISPTMAVIKATAVDKSYLRHAMAGRFVCQQIDALLTGTTRSSLGIQLLRKLKIPTPASAEQAVIAQILDTLDTQIRQTEALIAKLERIKQGLLTDLLTRGIDENGQLRPAPEEAPHLYKDSPLGWIPREWVVSTIGSEFEVQLGKMLDAEKNVGELKLYLGNKSVQWERIDLSELGEIRLTASDKERFRLRKGDLLVCEGGEVGRAAIWDDQIEECYYQKALHRLRPKRGFRSELMLQFLRYWTQRDMLAIYTSQTSIAHLSKEKLEVVPLVVPPSDEQTLIVDMLHSYQRRERLERDHLDALSSLKSGLMDDLLTGRVRVSPLLETGPTSSLPMEAADGL